MPGWQSSAAVPAAQKRNTPMVGRCRAPCGCAWEWGPGPGVMSHCLWGLCVSQRDPKHPCSNQRHPNEPWGAQHTWECLSTVPQGYHQGTAILWELPNWIFSLQNSVNFSLFLEGSFYFPTWGRCAWEGNAGFFLCSVVFCVCVRAWKQSAKLPFKKSERLSRNADCDSIGGHR